MPVNVLPPGSGLTDPPAPLPAWLAAALTCLALLPAVHHWTRGWTRRRPFGAMVLVGAGMGMGGVLVGGRLLPWLLLGPLLGALLGGLFVAVRGLHWGLVPVLVAVAMVLDGLEQAARGLFPGALGGGVLAVLLLAGAAWLWSREVGRGAPPSPP